MFLSRSLKKNLLQISRIDMQRFVCFVTKFKIIFKIILCKYHEAKHIDGDINMH